MAWWVCCWGPQPAFIRISGYWPGGDAPTRHAGRHGRIHVTGERGWCHFGSHLSPLQLPAEKLAESVNLISSAPASRFGAERGSA